MARFVGGGVAAFAMALLASCGSSSLESSSAAVGDNTCGSAVACEGNTPGFWSNKNGCDALNGNAQLLAELNAFLSAAGRDTVTLADDCAALDELLKVDATEMSDKLVAMFSAFLLNNWDHWADACGKQGLSFSFDAERWASAECRSTVAGWFASDPVSFQDVYDAVLAALGAGSCEQEALKDFLDAANNDANVCVCPCVTGGVSGGSGL
jgi:hypothetical protein